MTAVGKMQERSTSIFTVPLIECVMYMVTDTLLHCWLLAGVGMHAEIAMSG